METVQGVVVGAGGHPALIDLAEYGVGYEV